MLFCVSDCVAGTARVTAVYIDDTSTIYHPLISYLKTGMLYVGQIKRTKSAAFEP